MIAEREALRLLCREFCEHLTEYHGLPTWPELLAFAGSPPEIGDGQPWRDAGAPERSDERSNRWIVAHGFMVEVLNRLCSQEEMSTATRIYLAREGLEYAVVTPLSKAALAQPACTCREPGARTLREVEGELICPRCGKPALVKEKCQCSPEAIGQAMRAASPADLQGHAETCRCIVCGKPATKEG